ncbi:flagellar brake protein [Teredinibacter turnerae]|uniref:flagellar brake protein n=1 Tax=Teredinibacter turnerae TaxID=2426 RepID=UPI0005F7F448|nr:flagellar brake protein [Teredinibacter turnerae]
MTEETHLHFDQLNLKFGQRLQLLPNPAEPGERYESLLLGCLPGETVMITPPPDGEYPLLSEGQRVVIRVTTSGGVALFPSQILHIAEVPLYILYLDFPSAIKYRQVRVAARVNVSLPVLLSNLTSGQLGPIAGRASDISLGGAKVVFDQRVGDIGDEVELKGKFEIAQIKRILSVSAQIRTEKQTPQGYEYGIQFFEQEEDKQLVLFGFIYSALAMSDANKLE